MADVRSEIEMANQRFMAAVAARDEQSFVTLYTPDAVLLLPGREPLEGIEGVRTFFLSFNARGVCQVRLTTIEVEAFDDTAWERGRSETVDVDGRVIGRGKYIVIWKRAANGWQLHRDILNAST